MNLKQVFFAMAVPTLMIAAVMVVGSGCSAKDDGKRTTGSEAAATGGAKKALEGQQKMPIRLNLYGQNNGDTLLLDLVVDVTKKLPVEPMVNFKLPEGTEVRSPGPVTAIKLSPLAGQTMRRYAFRNVQGPIVVTADVSSPAFGYHAEAQWPPKEQPEIVPPKEVAIPAVNIHGIPVDRAIQLDPGQRAVGDVKAAGTDGK